MLDAHLFAGLSNTTRLTIELNIRSVTHDVWIEVRFDN